MTISKKDSESHVVLDPSMPNLEVVEFAWTGNVRCSRCSVAYRDMADIAVTVDGDVWLDLHVRWGNFDDTIRTHRTRRGMAPLSWYENPRLEWQHTCGRDDGPADLGRLVSDALNVKYQRRGYITA